MDVKEIKVIMSSALLLFKHFYGVDPSPALGLKFQAGPNFLWLFSRYKSSDHLSHSHQKSQLIYVSSPV